MGRFGRQLIDSSVDYVRNNVGLVVIVLAGAALLASVALSPPANPNSVEISAATINAAATNANNRAPTLIAQLTLTPYEFVLTQAAPTIQLLGKQEIRQFAASAWASSERGEIDWGAEQAAGPQNTEGCGDFRTAYSTPGKNDQAVLTLLFPQLVTPTGILIYESYNPGFITRIEVTDTIGEVHVVYEVTPGPILLCPFVLVVPIIDADYQANAVTLYIDQTSSTAGWDQIDAVQLVGVRFN